MSRNQSTFEKACRDLAARPELTANLKQLDLRVWDYYGEENYVAGSLSLDTVQISAHRAGQFASMADPRIMTISFFDWHHLAMAGPEG